MKQKGKSPSAEESLKTGLSFEKLIKKALNTPLPADLNKKKRKKK